MSEGLSPEDSFRLQVLLAQDLKAIRIDESTLTLHALTDKGEASIPLSPNCRADKYLRQVRELLSGHALGSPGGYPVFLTRWTRHGQMEGLNLGKLLLTGEPEAVVAVVHSPGLTDDLARHAWWTLPTIENARLMLRREAVARGPMGRVLADFLVEHLPFLQDDHLGIIDTVAVLIYSGAVTPAGLETMWKFGRRSNTHYVAFLEMAAGNLPLALPAHAQHAAASAERATEPALQLLERALSSQGQTFLDAAGEILERPETQEVVSRTLNAIGRYFSDGIDLQPNEAGPDAAGQPWAEKRQAAIRLAACDDSAVKAIFARSTAIGSLMRRKIEPVIGPLLTDIAELRR
ncbi:MAG: hypothetical protein B7Y41_05870 [Hydrogenophilales bacterium 28-61-23]|nr:MAG: hypothetical protein B7Y41_05870 [Hydrogenophilales bacterium 28-61-23]